MATGERGKDIKTYGELIEWNTTNERLYRTALKPTGPGLLDYDEETELAVEKRCIREFGEVIGRIYFQTFVATFPERNKELFPELFDENGNLLI